MCAHCIGKLSNLTNDDIFLDCLVGRGSNEAGKEEIYSSAIYR